jgi:hypothetical protein
MIQTIGIVVVIMLTLFALLMLYSKLITKLANKGAEKAARKFCKENDLQFIELHESQNNYVLYYQQEGELYSSKFHFESDGVIIWIKSII